MIKSSSIQEVHKMAFVITISLAIFAPSTLIYFMPRLPWLGAAIGMAGLFGALMVCWHAGFMRARFIILFAIALFSVAMWVFLK